MSIDTEVVIDEKIKKEIDEPSLYKVVFLNDDHTPMDFVIDLCKNIFKHSQHTAEKITLTIHEEGSGVAGIYTYEIAEQKAVEATNASRDRGFPLKIFLEQE